MPNVNATLSEKIIDATKTGTGDPAELDLLEAVTPSAAELNILDGVTATASELNILDGVTATASELNILDGVTATANELNILDGVTATAAELNMNDDSAATVTVAIAASATTDDMDITITAKDAASATLDAVHNLEVWMSEDSTGIGLTADTYSGDLTAGTGAILTALTAKKHWSVVTAASGIFVGTLVDSANPADQYVAVRNPFNGKVVVSAVSGTNWEGV